MGIGRELVGEEEEEEGAGRKGIIVGKLRVEKQRWGIIGVYISDDIERKLKDLKD